MEDLGEKVLNSCLEEHAKEHVADAHAYDFPPAPIVLSSLFVAEYKRRFSMLFGIGRKFREGGVEEEKADGGKDVEKYSNGEGANELYFKGRMREDKS